MLKIFFLSFSSWFSKSINDEPVLEQPAKPDPFTRFVNWFSEK